MLTSSHIPSIIVAFWFYRICLCVCCDMWIWCLERLCRCCIRMAVLNQSQCMHLSIARRVRPPSLLSGTRDPSPYINKHLAHIVKQIQHIEVIRYQISYSSTRDPSPYIAKHLLSRVKQTQHRGRSVKKHPESREQQHYC